MHNDLEYYDEANLFEGKKWGRKERKLAQRRDRSKYKKSDQDQEKKLAKGVHYKEPFARGIVTGIQGSEIHVDSQGKKHICTLRGTLKQDVRRLKNLVVVGDFVHFDSGDAITEIEPRQKSLSRADHLSQQKEHCLAANVDLVLITTSCVDPPLRPTIIDRYLIAAEKGGLHPVIICNKVDLLDSPDYPLEKRAAERALFDECKKIYTSLGIAFIAASCETGEGLPLLKETMSNRISVFSGQSGSGKSSLINAITGWQLKIGKTVAHSKKGSHTTSSTALLALPFGGYVVDTPGIKSFGVWDLEPKDVRHFFPEIALLATSCKFSDCSHRGEEGCAIRDALEQGKISSLRYESYLNIVSSLEIEHLRR
jgi:ribosome biogenesis GTPase